MRSLFSVLLASVISTVSFADLTCDIGEYKQYASGGFQLGNLSVTNTGAENLVWAIQLNFDVDVTLTKSWSSKMLELGQSIYVEGVNSTKLLKPGESAGFGMQGTGAFTSVSCEAVEVIVPEVPALPNGGIAFIEDFEGFDAGDGWRDVPDVKVVDQCGAGHDQCLRASYAPTERGSDRLQTKIAIAGGEHYSLVYDIYFEEGFEFVRGGKLPGLSPTIHTTGCSAVIANGWSVRPMWRPDGAAEAYYYNQERAADCGEGERSFRGHFVTGRWQRIELEVKLNSQTNSFDGHVILKVDSEEVSASPAEGVNLRGVINDDTLINQFFFSTFYGGADSSWAPSKTTHIRYDNFTIINHDGEVTGPMGPNAPIDPPEAQQPNEGSGGDDNNQTDNGSTTTPETGTAPDNPVNNPQQDQTFFEPSSLDILNINDVIVEYNFDDLATGFYDKQKWVDAWENTNYFINGANENRLFVDNEVNLGEQGNSIRTLFPANTSTSGDSGAQFHLETGGVHEEAYLSYWVKFDHDFDFALGGKLPGFFLSESYTERGEDSSVRLMWREEGKAEFYLHLDADPARTRIWWDTEGFQPKFQPGKWHQIEIFVRLNTPGVADGILEGYFDGVKAASLDDLLFRSDSADGKNARIARVFFSTFFGGSSSSDWFAKKDEFAWFDEFVVSYDRLQYAENPHESSTPSDDPVINGPDSPIDDPDSDKLPEDGVDIPEDQLPKPEVPDSGGEDTSKDDDAQSGEGGDKDTTTSLPEDVDQTDNTTDSTTDKDGLNNGQPLPDNANNPNGDQSAAKPEATENNTTLSVGALPIGMMVALLIGLFGLRRKAY